MRSAAYRVLASRLLLRPGRHGGRPLHLRSPYCRQCLHMAALRLAMPPSVGYAARAWPCHPKVQAATTSRLDTSDSEAGQAACGVALQPEGTGVDLRISDRVGQVLAPAEDRRAREGGD